MKPTETLRTLWTWDRSDKAWVVVSHGATPTEVESFMSGDSGRVVTEWSLSHGVRMTDFWAPGDDFLSQGTDPRHAFGHGLELHHLTRGGDMRELVVAEVVKRLAQG